LFALLSAGRAVGEGDFEVASLHEHLACYLSLLRALAPCGFSFRDVVIDLADTTVIGALLQAQGITPEALHRSVRTHAHGSAGRFVRERAVVLPEEVDEATLARDVVPRLPPPVRDGAGARLLRIEREVCAPLRTQFP